MTSPVSVVEFSTGEKEYRFEVWPDPDPTSPRENDNLGTMLYSHSRYVLGDERTRCSSFDEYLESAKISPDEVVSLPLYLSDHSGLKMSTQDFNDPWDSGVVGVIFVPFEKLRDEFGVATVDEQTIERAQNVLRAEVEEFSQYLEGDIYGFRLRRKEGDKWVEEESGWGFYGADPLENGMLDYLDESVAQLLTSQLSPPKRAFR